MLLEIKTPRKDLTWSSRETLNLTVASNLNHPVAVHCLASPFGGSSYKYAPLDDGGHSFLMPSTGNNVVGAPGNMLAGINAGFFE